MMSGGGRGGGVKKGFLGLRQTALLSAEGKKVFTIPKVVLESVKHVKSEKSGPNIF
jgi:hypothetical protein